MHAIDDGRLLLLQRLGGGDVGLDHELFDEPMRLQPLGHVDDAGDVALVVEQHLALGQVEIERLAAVARRGERGIGGPQRLQRALEQRARLSGDGLPSMAACAS